MIFCHHWGMDPYPHYMQLGAFPVSFFFILSGYCLSCGYGDRINNSVFVYSDYLKKRLLKLFPINTSLLILLIIVKILFDLKNQHFSIGDYILFIPDFLLIQSWIPMYNVYFSGNAVAWFLSDLLFFYVLFPILYKFLVKYNHFAFIGSLLLYIITIHIIPDSLYHAFIYINPLFRIVDFIIGIWLFNSIKTINEKLSSNMMFAVCIEFFSVVLVVLTLYFFNNVNVRYSYDLFYWIPSAISIISLTYSEKVKTLLSRLLSSPIMILGGGISFYFYMIHLIIIRAYSHFQIQSFSKIDYLGFVLCISISLVISFLLYHEKMFSNWSKRLFRQTYC